MIVNLILIAKIKMNVIKFVPVQNVNQLLNNLVQQRSAHIDAKEEIAGIQMYYPLFVKMVVVHFVKDKFVGILSNFQDSLIVINLIVIF